MEIGLAFIGFGEAAAALAGAVPARGYDRRTDAPATCEAKLADFAASGVAACADTAAAVAGASAVLSLVTADRQLAAAEAAAPYLTRGALYFDMNSVAPDAKRAAARIVEAAGARYVDVAVMAPVHPQRHKVPMLVSGPHAADALAALSAIGLTNAKEAPGPVGTASSIKMIRSVMVKGIEALTAECVLAAQAAGVLDAVLASLDASPPQPTWVARADYNLDRMMVHGLRRAAEMEEVVRTLDALGTGSVMSRGTIVRQRAIGALGLLPVEGLLAKLDCLPPFVSSEVEKPATSATRGFSTSLEMNGQVGLDA